MKTKIYSAPRAEVRKASIRASILAGSSVNSDIGVTGEGLPFVDARERSTVSVDASRD